MPDAQGNFKGISVSGEAWTRVFGDEQLPKVRVRPVCEHFFVPGSQSPTSHAVICKHCDEVRYDTLPHAGWRDA